MKSNYSLNLWGCNSKPVPSEIHLAERKHIQFYHCPICFGISENHSVIQLPKFARLYFCLLHKKWRWQKQLWAGQFPVFSQAQGYLIIFTSLGPHKRFGDNNESTRRQEYAKSGSIWDITYNLAHGTRVVRTRWRSTSSSSTSPCPVLWYIVRNSSHPQTSALEDKSGKQNHLRAQDVLPVHPVPTIWSRSSSTCKTAMVETCKPYFAKVLQSNSIQSLQLSASTMYDWLRDHSYVHEGN